MLLYLFSLLHFEAKVNAEFTVLAIEHWLLWCKGHIKICIPFLLNVQAF